MRRTVRRPRAALLLSAVLLLPAAPAIAEESPDTAAGPDTTVAEPGGSPTPSSTPAAPVATSLSLSTSSSAVTYPGPVRVVARLTRSSDGTPVAGETVELLTAAPGSGAWTTSFTGTTSPDGEVVSPLVADRHVDVQARTLPSATALSSSSAVRRLSVRPSLAVKAPAAVRVGTTATLSGSLAPARPGRIVSLQRWQSGAWRHLSSTTLSTSSSYAFRVTLASPGFWRYRVTVAVSRDLTAATTTLRPIDAYRLATYSVTTRGAVVVDMTAFRKAVAAVYDDPRGWLRAHRRFVRVPSGGSFTVVMAQASQVPRFSSGCSARYSCRVGRYVIVNQDRWRHGSRPFTGTLSEYRQMVVNHETGHWLGLGHQSCPAVGRPAPVMQQQSISLKGCAPNAWPLPAEIARAR